MTRGKENNPLANGEQNDEREDTDAEALEDVRQLIESIPHELLVRELEKRMQNPAEEDMFPRVSTIGVSRQFSGPLPPPEMLDQYNQVEPGAANRILRMAEKEQSHRHDRESEAVAGEIAKDRRGQNYALLVSMTIILGSIGLIAIGEQIYGTVLAGGTLIGLAGTFIAGRRSGSGHGQNHKKSN